MLEAFKRTSQVEDALMESTATWMDLRHISEISRRWESIQRTLSDLNPKDFDALEEEIRGNRSAFQKRVRSLSAVAPCCGKIGVAIQMIASTVRMPSANSSDLDLGLVLQALSGQDKQRNISEFAKDLWALLASQVYTLDQGSRLNKLQFYVKAMILDKESFVEGPCNEEGAPRGTCFNDSDPNKPRMIVSRSYNRMTTPDQAIALVFHEAGHFTGETDHLFLSQFGTVMTAQRLARPKSYKASGYAWALQAYSGQDVSGVVIDSCREAKDRSERLATNACLAAGNQYCWSVTSATKKQKAHTRIFSSDWAECWTESVVAVRSFPPKPKYKLGTDVTGYIRCYMADANGKLYGRPQPDHECQAE
jgi:hypothetical protein